MLIRLLQIPIIDVILILLALRFIWPGLFGIRSKKLKDRKNVDQKIFTNKGSSSRAEGDSQQQGKYIDYEEIK